MKTIFTEELCLQTTSQVTTKSILSDYHY